jgi:HK97 family phage prohead protease
MPERNYKSVGGGLMLIEFKAEKEGSFRATFSRFNVIDRDGDVTVPGAFEKGQAVRIAQWGHNWSAPAIGDGTIDFDNEKAWVDGEFYLDTAVGMDTYKAVKRLSQKELQEWSYGFAIKERSFGEFGDPPQQVQFLRRLDVFEVSPVMIGAGIGTGTDAIKGAELSLPDHTERVLAGCKELADRFQERAEARAKEGRTLSTANRERLKANREALTGVIADLDALLAATEPDDGKGLGLAEIIEIEKERARFLGVAV